MPPAASISIPTKLLATGVACAVAVIVCGTAATVVVASDVTNKVSRNSRTTATALEGAASGATPFRDIGATAQAIDSLLEPLGAPPPMDPRALAPLNAFNSVQGPNPVWVEAPASLPAPVPVARYQRTPAEATAGITRDEMGLAARATTDPWLPLFRAWARGPRQPALWGYRVGLPGGPDARALPMRSFGPWRAMFAENEYALRMALQSGRYDEAMQRALENVAAARQFVEQPLIIDAFVGRTYLMRGFKMVAVVAKKSGDTATARRALKLDLEARSFPNVNAVRALAQEPGDALAAALAFVGNRDNHPALRVEAMRTITEGGCHRLPEIVFGFSGARRDALVRASAELSDVARGDELAQREQRLFDYISTVESTPDSFPKNSVLEKNALLNAFAWIVPPAVRARAAICLGANIRAETTPVRENAIVGVH